MKQSPYLFCFYDKNHFQRFLTGLLILAFFAAVGAFLMPQADAAAFSCNAGTASGNMFADDTVSDSLNNENGTATPITLTGGSNDDPFTSGGACSPTLGVFGRVMCFFKTTVGQIVSTMYCNFQNQLLGPLSICMELFIALLGIFFITGMSNMNAREAITALLKIALVWAFAMNASWGIGIGYSFFMGIAEEGTSLVLNAVSSGSGGGYYLSHPDEVIDSIFNYATMGQASGNPITMPTTLTPFCAVMLFTFFFLILLALPTLGGSILAMMVQYIWLYVRALLGYLTALVLIGFLFILAPIFLCFALFKSTRALFEKWLQYLTSFSLQMVIVFGFLALLSLIPIPDFFMEIMNLIRQYDVTWAGYQAPMPNVMCSVCQYTINNAVTLGSGTYPVTCTGGTGGSAIPISQLFTAQDLVQAILSQAIALWVVGGVMLDFLKQAPEFARQLAGRLPFAAVLGGSPDPNSTEAAGIGYAGADLLDDYIMGNPAKGMQGLVGKLKDPASYQGWRRAVPAGLLTAPLIGAALLRRGNNTGSVPLAPGSSTTSTANSLTSSAPSAYESVGDGKALAAGFSQSAQALLKKSALVAGNVFSGAASAGDALMLGASSSSSSTQTDTTAPASAIGVRQYKFGMRLDAAQQKFVQAKVTREDSYQTVVDALYKVEVLQAKGASGDELAGAMKVLKESHELSLMASDLFFDSQQRVMKEKMAMREQVESSGTPVSGPSISERRDQLSDILQSLQMQVKVRQTLSPGQLTDNARAALDGAQTAFLTANSTEALAPVQAAIDQVKKMLV